MFHIPKSSINQLWKAADAALSKATYYLSCIWVEKREKQNSIAAFAQHGVWVNFCGIFFMQLIENNQ